MTFPKFDEQNHSLSSTVALFALEVRERVHRILGRFMIKVAIVAIVSLVSEYGFHLASEFLRWLHTLGFLIIGIVVLHQGIRLLLAVHRFYSLKSRRFEFLLTLLLPNELG
ncbi:MAG: hypothetical protein ACE5H0_02960 [Bacteroidota bacterium]